MRSRGVSAFSLIEVSIAMGLAVFCIVIIFALLPVGLNSNKDAIEQSMAMNVLSTIAADLWSTASVPGQSGTSSQYRIVIPPASASGETIMNTVYLTEEGIPTEVKKARYRVQYWITTPANSAKVASTARMLLTWPAMADPMNASGRMETMLALDRN